MILHLSTFQREGGAAVAATRLHRALRQTGVDSQLLVHTLTSPEAGTSALAESTWQRRRAWGRFVAERLYFLPHEKDKSVRFAFSPARVGADLSQHPLVQQADVLHLHWVNFGFLSLKSLEKLFTLGKPIVWTLHDMWAFTGGCHYSRGCERYLTHCQLCPYLRCPGENDLSYRVFEEKKKRWAAAPITSVSPSQWLGSLVQKAPLSQHRPVRVLPNPLDTALFRPLDRAQIRQQLGLAPTKKYLLFAGANTQDPRKGFAYFRDALRLLKYPASELEVLVFGKSQPEALTQLDLPVRDLGTLTREADIVAAYNAADLLVVPSLEDNYPNTILEAMACGTPVVGFGTGGIPEQIRHRHDGYLVPSTSADDLARGIDWVLAEVPAERLREAARQRAVDSWSYPVVAGQFSELYQSLL